MCYILFISYVVILLVNACVAGTYSVCYILFISCIVILLVGACAAGTYSVWNTTTSQPQCVNCPLNQYKVGTTLLAQNCTQCPPGTYTLQTGSTSPSQCISE